MNNKNIRVYRLISKYKQEETEEGLDRLSRFDLIEISNFINNTPMLDFGYDGEVCHPLDGDFEYTILFGNQKDVDFVIKMVNKIHEGFEGEFIIDDITEDVLYDMFDTSIFGDLELDVKSEFHDYKVMCLTKDDVLDKMIKYGKVSLSENDKLLLDDKEMIPPM